MLPISTKVIIICNLPFVYSVNNKDIEKLNNRQYDGSGADCNKEMCLTCMPPTSLEVSWSGGMGQVYAFTHLSEFIF
ncbi:unnamed protein product [Meloidogyne enterolobii]|uniref:Uncharacterized protein n=1 Tax=Meloidogyne enterolobii TaxID=390850 RepID=A0ACB0Z018_MELEN